MTLDDGVRSAFEQAVGAANVASDPARLRSYECDGLTGYRVVPALVLLPDNAAQVAAAVRACAAHDVPFVARGAGTGLSGGTLPVAEGVVISLQRLRRVLEWTRWWTGSRYWSPGSPTWTSPAPAPRTGCTTRPTRPASRSAPSAATSRRTPAARTA